MKIINSNSKKILLAVLALIFVVGIVIFSIDFYQKQKAVESLSGDELLKAPKEKIIDYKVLGRPGKEEESIVRYSYISNQEVPPMLYNGLKEDLSKRTESSMTFLESVKPINKKFQEEKYVARFFSGKSFERVGNKWYKIEAATTTAVSFKRQVKLTVLDRVKEFFGKKALADLTSYFFSGSGDGWICYGGSTSWATTHNATTGNCGSMELVDAYSGINYNAMDSTFAIYRTFLPFDTSSIRSGANIISATLVVYVNSVYDGSADGKNYINVVESSQSSISAWSYDNYDNFTNTVGATPISLTDIDSMGSGFIHFSLNNIGKGWIKRNGEASSCGTANNTTGVTCLGLREGHDLENVQATPIFGSDIRIHLSEAGMGYQPYLTVIYSEITPTKALIDGGTVKIDGGTLKLD